MTKAEPKRLTTGALGAVWRGPASRSWCFFSIHPGESMGYCGRYAGLRDFRAEAFSYNKRTMDRAMGPF